MIPVSDTMKQIPVIIVAVLVIQTANALPLSLGSFNPNTTPILCSNCNGQNTDMMCSRSGSFSCGDHGFLYNIQTPQNVPLPPRYTSYSYTLNTPSVQCPQTLKNVVYQLQLPAVTPEYVSSFGFLDGTTGKTYKKCSVCP